MKRTPAAALLALLIALPAHAGPITIPAAKAEETAKMVASVLIAGRAVVAVNQKLINDPSKGDKGFTPGVFEKAMLGEFEKITGKTPSAITDPDTRAAVVASIEAAKKAVANNQGRINEPGKAFKGFIPAVFGRITGNILKGEAGVEIKQTTFTPRNEYNKPDDYELKVLNAFKQTKPKTGAGEQVGNRYRYLHPLYIAEACLSCHGDPRGEIDIAGKPKEGYKLGDLRGAISVTLQTK